MNEDEQRRMLQTTRQVQNIQLRLTLGLIVGGIVGLIIGAWVVMPTLGFDTWAGIIGVLVSIVVGAWLGQRVMLNILTR